VGGAQAPAQQGVAGGEEPAHGDAVQGGGEEQAGALGGAADRGFAAVVVGAGGLFFDGDGGVDVWFAGGVGEDPGE
jgi:hypothetical protein